jgi:hypothetical protein
MDGTVIITAIIVPFNTISGIRSLDFVVSDNIKILKNGNKNQRYFIFGEHRFVLFVKVTKKHNSNEQSLNFVIPIVVILFFRNNIYNDSKS